MRRAWQSQRSGVVENREGPLLPVNVTLANTDCMVVPLNSYNTAPLPVTTFEVNVESDTLKFEASTKMILVDAVQLLTEQPINCIEVEVWT